MRLLFYLLCAGLLLPCATAAKAGDAGGGPKIVLASLQPLSGCKNPSESWLKTGCVEVPKAMDRITVPCKRRPGMCPLSWGLPAHDTAWPAYRSQSLPHAANKKRLAPIIVLRPATRRARLRRHRVARITTASRYVPSQSTLGREIARRVGLQVGQQVGFVFGGPFGAMGVCTGLSFAYLVKDGLDAKEKWTPIDTVGNLLLTGISCSPIGFIMRMAQAKTDQERFTALLGGGLGFVNSPIAGIASQTLSAGQALMPAVTPVQPVKPVVRLAARHKRRNRIALQ